MKAVTRLSAALPMGNAMRFLVPKMLSKWRSDVPLLNLFNDLPIFFRTGFLTSLMYCRNVLT